MSTSIRLLVCFLAPAAGVLVSAGGCADAGDVHVPSAPPTSPVDPVPPGDLLALGDSYTAGTSVGPGLVWHAQLADALAAEGRPLGEVDVVAANGWTTTDLLAGLTVAELAPPYDVVTLMIGVNNQVRGLAQDDYVREFTALADSATALAVHGPGGVVVLSIPDYGVTPVGRNFGAAQAAEGVDSFNAAARAVADSLGLRWVDVTGTSRAAADDPLLVARDGLHFSGEMHRRWVELLLPVVRAVRNQETPRAPTP